MNYLIPIEDELKRTINPNILTVSDFRKRLETGNNFINKITEQAIIPIKGSIDEFGKPGKD